MAKKYLWNYSTVNRFQSELNNLPFLESGSEDLFIFLCFVLQCHCGHIHGSKRSYKYYS